MAARLTEGDCPEFEVLNKCIEPVPFRPVPEARPTFPHGEGKREGDYFSTEPLSDPSTFAKALADREGEVNVYEII